MPIQEDARTATRADIAAALAIAQNKLREIEATQAGHLRRHAWAPARALTPDIASQRSWLQDLTRYQAGLDVEPAPAPAEALAEWRAWLPRLEREYDHALAAAITRRDREAYAWADAAWRTVSAFRHDAYGATGDEVFHSRRTPAPPSQYLELEPLAKTCNRFEVRPPVDRARWAHLLAPQ